MRMPNQLSRTIALVPAALLALLLAACGAAQTTAPAAAPTADSMAGMDHSSMEGMDHSSMEGMDHSSTAAAGQPYDAAFIDGMIVHHEGALVMARQALEQAERPEIKELASAIVSAQEAEIAQMQEWRAAWYPDLAETGGMAMEMGPMEVPAGDAPFDQRFIQAMIPHHEGAIAMARDALEKAERQEIRDLASAIISAQEAEIAQMRQWLNDWYGIAQ